MLDSTLSQLIAQWFDEYHRLAYWLARRWAQRLLAYRGRSYSANELEELAQDAVCRGFARFAKRCQREVCGASDRKRWVCQCVSKGAFDAMRCKSRFGSISAPASVRDDVMNRCQRVDNGFTHGNDNDKQNVLAQLSYAPIEHPVQRWELEQLIAHELPAHLRATALYAACGLTQEQSAILQSVSDRTIRSRLTDIRNLLWPQSNVYAVICEALQTCLDKPRELQPLLPILTEALAG